ncbi:MAG: SGNH/GDSL hydrolase family protein [Clostridia bacterium]|nr:SGNH/GDSL hydrolase family protein [Clostridia bacterium]
MIFENYDRIVFAGDSVTSMGSNQPVGEGLRDNVGFGFVRVIENLLSAFYPEVILRITNCGVSGDTTVQLLDRYDHHVVDLKPDWVAICIGINEVWRQFDSPAMQELHVSPEQYRANVEEMIRRVKDTVKGILILSPYMMEPNREDPMRKRMDEYVEVSRQIAEKHGCIFVDFQKMYDEYCQIRHNCYIAWDRIHPNQVGATLMACEVLKHCGFDFGRLAGTGSL